MLYTKKLKAKKMFFSLKVKHILDKDKFQVRILKEQKEGIIKQKINCGFYTKISVKKKYEIFTNFIFNRDFGFRFK